MRTTRTEENKKIIDSFVDDSRKVLHKNLQMAYLFGSYARQEATELSDIDILLIVNSSTADVKRKISGLASRLCAGTRHFDFTDCQGVGRLGAESALRNPVFHRGGRVWD